MLDTNHVLEDFGIPDGTLTDHDGIRFCFFENVEEVSFIDGAVGDDRDGDSLLDGPNDVVMDRAHEAFFTCPAMDGDGFDAAGFHFAADMPDIHDFIEPNTYFNDDRFAGN